MAIPKVPAMESNLIAQAARRPAFLIRLLTGAVL